ncbi:MAG: nucleotidyltransferase family protein [Acidimicrobiales bacterium]
MADAPSAVDTWLRALAGLGLAGSPPPGPPPPIGELLAGAARHKLVGVLAAAVSAGVVDPDPVDLALIADAHEGAMREVLLLEEELLRAIDVLDAAGVDSRVVKGAALAHMIHPDPSERCFGDNDVLVASADIDASVAALIDAGATRPIPALSPSFDRRFAKSVTLRWSGATELDLHRTLAAGPYGKLIELDDLMRDPVEILLAGRAVRTLPADLHLLHGAIHVALGDVDPRLGNVRDLALLAAWPSIDVDAVVDAATRWGCAAPVACGLQTTVALGHRRSAIEQWADAFVVNETDRRRLAVYRHREGRYRRQARATWAVLGWGDRFAFSRALMVPSAANRSARKRARPS